MPKSTGEDWLSAPETAAALGVTLRTVYSIIDSGELVAYKFRRVLRIRRADLDDYMERCRVVPGDLSHLLYSQDSPEPDEI